MLPVYVAEAAHNFGERHVTLVYSRLRSRCAAQLCNAAFFLTKSAVGLQRLRDLQILNPLENIKTLFKERNVIDNASRAIMVLSV